jgi:hypothetical protein
MLRALRNLQCLLCSDNQFKTKQPPCMARRLLRPIMPEAGLLEPGFL